MATDDTPGTPNGNGDLARHAHLLYHFCRLQLPSVVVPGPQCERNLSRTFGLYQGKAGADGTWPHYLENLHPLDWYVAAACLEGNGRAWEYLFAARAGRSDCLLVDALRARAARLYPRDDEKQDSAVTEFWSHLYVPDGPSGVPVLARYDGLRPLVPWLIRVFQNWHISQLRRRGPMQQFPEDDLPLPLPSAGDGRWHESFNQAAREYLTKLKDNELLILGLRLRYDLSQREVAALLKVHEGTVSRRTDQLREQCLEYIAQKLREQGWTGNDLYDYVRTEMFSLLLDDPRLSVDYLAHLLAQKGLKPLTDEPALLVQCGRGKGKQQDERVGGGFGYKLVQGTPFDDWPEDGGCTHCWTDPQEVRFEVTMPPKTPGLLRLFFLDGDGQRRRQRVTVQGTARGDVADFGGDGTTLETELTAKETATGRIEGSVTALTPASAVVSSVTFIPTPQGKV